MDAQILLLVVLYERKKYLEERKQVGGSSGSAGFDSRSVKDTLGKERPGLRLTFYLRRGWQLLS